MTPAEFELAQERIEDAYKRQQIGKVAFIRRMKALGFRVETCRDMAHEIDVQRSK
jgi:DNA-binding transcriptional MerR regulator